MSGRTPTWQPGIEAPATRAVAITPSDTVNLAEVSRGLYVGTAGNATILLGDDTSAVVFTGLAAGLVYPLQVKRVNAGSLTAGNLVALY